MTDQLLGILKLALLALLYLFFARVLWAVWTEVRGAGQPLVPQAPVPQPADHGKPPAPAATSRRERRKHAKRPAGQVARLVVVEPSLRRGAVLGVDRELTFGRAAGCTVSMPDDAYMSQIHARVYMQEGDVYVEDLGSTNGTFVNGERLRAPQQLLRGDHLQVGHMTLDAD